MKKNINLITGLLIIIAQFSCKEVSIPTEKPQYNVYCILNPEDKKIELFLGKTFSLNNKITLDSGKVVKDAMVKIISNDSFVTLNFNSLTKKYETNNEGFIQEEKKYSLEIVLNNEAKPLLAETIVPKKVGEINYEFQTEANNATLRLSLKNETTQSEFYSVVVNFIMSTTFYGHFSWDGDSNIWWSESIANSILKTPTGVITNFDKIPKETKLAFNIKNYDKFYFDYAQKNTKRQQQDGGLIEKFSQPVVLPSNIQNGLGIFSSFTEKQIIINLK